MDIICSFQQSLCTKYLLLGKDKQQLSSFQFYINNFGFTPKIRI